MINVSQSWPLLYSCLFVVSETQSYVYSSHLFLNVFFGLFVCLTAKTVSLDGKALNYVPLESSFAAYSENSWTYDGR